jgi:hypothetical protein
VKNVSIPESTLLKRHNAINYHIRWESVAAKIICVGKEDSKTNNADMLTKSVTAERRWDLCWNIMVWFMGISYLENFLTWQYWLIGGWFDNILGMEHENTYMANSGITENASLSFLTTLCSTEICIRWTWDNNILYQVASLHFINSQGALEFQHTHVCDVSMHIWMKIDFDREPV